MNHKLQKEMADHLHGKNSRRILPGAKKKYVDPCTSSMDLQGTTLNGASNEVSSTRVVARDQLRMGVDTFETPTVVHSSFNRLRKPKETFVSRKSDGQRDSVRHVFESNDKTATSGIDEESDASSDGGSICDEETHLISSGEASTAKDPEWGILSKFQRDFRLRTNISVRKFLILLGIVPTKSLEAFLWKPQKLIPSGRAGTIGCLLREKLTEFMEKELKNSMDCSAVGSNKANTASDSVAAGNLHCKRKKGFSVVSSSPVPMQIPAPTNPRDMKTKLVSKRQCAQPDNLHNTLKRRSYLIVDSDTEKGNSSDSIHDHNRGSRKKATVIDHGGRKFNDFDSNGSSSSGFTSKLAAHPYDTYHKDSSNILKDSDIPPRPPPQHGGYSSSGMVANSKSLLPLPTPSLAEDRQIRTEGVDVQKEIALTAAQNDLVKSIMKHLEVCAQYSKTSCDVVVDDCIKAAEKPSSLAAEPRAASAMATRVGAAKSAIASSHTLESIPRTLQQYYTSRDDANAHSSGKAVGKSIPSREGETCEKNPQQSRAKCTACGKRGHVFDDCWYVESHHVNVNWNRTKSFSASEAGKLYIASTTHSTLRMNVWVSPEDSIVHCHSQNSSSKPSSTVGGFHSGPVSFGHDDRNFSTYHHPHHHHQDLYYLDAHRDRDGIYSYHGGPDADRRRDRTLYKHFPCTACGKFNHSYERCFFLRCKNLHPFINFDRTLEFRHSGVGMDYARRTGSQFLIADDGFISEIDQYGREERRYDGQRSLERKEATAAMESALCRGAGAGQPEVRIQGDANRVKAHFAL